MNSVQSIGNLAAAERELKQIQQQMRGSQAQDVSAPAVGVDRRRVAGPGTRAATDAQLDAAAARSAPQASRAALKTGSSALRP